MLHSYAIAFKKTFIDTKTCLFWKSHIGSNSVYHSLNINHAKVVVVPFILERARDNFGTLKIWIMLYRITNIVFILFLSDRAHSLQWIAHVKPIRIFLLTVIWATYPKRYKRNHMGSLSCLSVYHRIFFPKLLD